jgi:hypothetical protein
MEEPYGKEEQRLHDESQDQRDIALFMFAGAAGLAMAEDRIASQGGMIR